MPSPCKRIWATKSSYQSTESRPRCSSRTVCLASVVSYHPAKIKHCMVGEHGDVQQHDKRSIYCRTFIFITAVGGAGGGGYGATVAVHPDIHQSASNSGSSGSSDPHDYDNRSLTTPDGRQSRESDVWFILAILACFTEWVQVLTVDVLSFMVVFYMKVRSVLL